MPKLQADQLHAGTALTVTVSSSLDQRHNSPLVPIQGDTGPSKIVRIIIKSKNYSCMQTVTSYHIKHRVSMFSASCIILLILKKLYI